MNRDIKFRVWDTDKQEMHQVNNILFSESSYTPERITAHLPSGQYNISGKIHGGRENAFKLLQFTSLHDKNGREIYEGDIVQFKRKIIEVVKVEFLADGFKCAVRTGTNTTTLFGLSHFLEKYHCKGIGNIYEDPDLLSK